MLSCRFFFSFITVTYISIWSLYGSKLLLVDLFLTWNLKHSMVGFTTEKKIPFLTQHSAVKPCKFYFLIKHWFLNWYLFLLCFRPIVNFFLSINILQNKRSPIVHFCLWRYLLKLIQGSYSPYPRNSLFLYFRNLRLKKNISLIFIYFLMIFFSNEQEW